MAAHFHNPFFKTPPARFRIGALIALWGFCMACCGCVWNSTEDNPDYLPLDDSEYPYTGLPRLVIDTENFSQIRNKTTKIPSQLQIWDEKQPSSEVIELSVNGRGNSSFTMAKHGIRLRFDQKQALFGMPKDKDWVLVANQRDKSLMRNFITYQLAKILQDSYAPRNHFVEVFLNRQYMGVYLLVEYPKVAKYRINITESDSSFFFEKTKDRDPDDKYFESRLGHTFVIRQPKDASQKSIALLKDHVDSLEQKLEANDINLEEWINVNDFIRYYWIQEFSKNIDGAFGRSIYLTWQPGNLIEMGPVWDFDLAYGIGNSSVMSSNDWYVRYQGWYKYLFKNESIKKRARQYWKEHRQQFIDLADSIESASKILTSAAQNDFKRWPVLDQDDYWPFVDSYKNYEEAVDSLKEWTLRRVQWIDEHL